MQYLPLLTTPERPVRPLTFRSPQSIRLHAKLRYQLSRQLHALNQQTHLAQW